MTPVINKSRNDRQEFIDFTQGYSSSNFEVSVPRVKSLRQLPKKYNPNTTPLKDKQKWDKYR